MFLSLEKYRGYTMSLEHLESGSYQLICTRGLVKFNSHPKTFTISQSDEAIAYGKQLIDEDADFCLFQREPKKQHFWNECKSNLAALDEEYIYDF
jgi:hypothetical protein